MDYPEYKPISHWCDCCGAEIEDEDDVFQADNGQWYCEECFRDYCIDNLDIYDMAKMWNIPVAKAVET